MKLLENGIQHWWQAGLLGVIMGMPVGLVLEYMRRMAHQAYVRQVTTEFASFGMHIVIYDPLKPWAVPLCTTVGFTAISLLSTPLFSLCVNINALETQNGKNSLMLCRSIKTPLGRLIRFQVIALFVLLAGTQVSCTTRGPVLETFEISNGTLRMKVTAHREVIHGPLFGLPGAYHVFSSSPMNQELWREIIVARYDDDVSLQRDSLKFVGNSVGYVFAQKSYAVTIDNGARWSVWTIPIELSPQDSDLEKIREVKLDGRGLGMMVVARPGNTFRVEFYTDDFGQHWMPKNGNELRQTEVLDSEEREVIETLVNDTRGKKERHTQIVISAMTGFHPFAKEFIERRLSLKRELSDLQDETIDNWVYKNQYRKVIRPGLNLLLKSHLINKAARLVSIEQELDQKRNGWKDFQEEFPGSYGIVEFSRPGFDKRREQALVFETVEFGIDGGYGNAVLMVRTKDGWKVKATIGAYIS